MLIPSGVIILLVIINMACLLLWWKRYKQWTAIALFIPMLYYFIVFLIIDTLQLPDAQVLGRLGVVVLLFCQGIVNAKFAGLIGGKHK